MNDRLFLERAIAQATGKPFAIRTLRAIGGGCISDAFLVADEQRRFFVKSNKPSFLDAFEAEAAALDAIALTGSVRVPSPLAAAASESAAYLVLEYLDIAAASSPDWARLGRELAALHTIRQPHFGWWRDNTIGSTPQCNAPAASWISFWGEQRLLPMLRRCRSRGFAFADSERLLDNLDTHFEGYAPTPSLLHGDLWSGNVAFDQSGAPFLFDPASYWGDRETDIAFTEFFGGFGQAFYVAYQVDLPLDPGYRHRKTLYNLYHCLNHAYLFGASYARQAQEMIAGLLKG